MVCSNCKQDGHTKAKCSNPKYESPSPVVQPDIPLLLNGEIRAKLIRLRDLSTEVATVLGKGYVEGVYQQGLATELQEAGIRHVLEEPMPIMYKGRPVGGGHTHRLDILLTSFLDFIFELKATPKMTSANHWQLVRYMVYKSIGYGAVVNFNQSNRGGLEIQFIVLYEGAHWLYDIDAQTGVKMVDYKEDEKDEWEEAWE